MCRLAITVGAAIDRVKRDRKLTNTPNKNRTKDSQRRPRKRRIPSPFACRAGSFLVLQSSRYAAGLTEGREMVTLTSKLAKTKGAGSWRKYRAATWAAG